MRIFLIATIVPAFLLAACGSRDVAQAEREYKTISGGDGLAQALNPMDKCKAAGRVKDAYARAGDKENYNLWALTEYNDCAAANR